MFFLFKILQRTDIVFNLAARASLLDSPDQGLTQKKAIVLEQ
jgi:hypothetical protein